LTYYESTLHANTSGRFIGFRFDVPQVGYIYANDSLAWINELDQQDQAKEVISHYGVTNEFNTNSKIIAESSVFIQKYQHEISDEHNFNENQNDEKGHISLEDGPFAEAVEFYSSQYSFVTEFDPFSLPLPPHFNIAWPVPMFIEDYLEDNEEDFNPETPLEKRLPIQNFSDISTDSSQNSAKTDTFPHSLLFNTAHLPDSPSITPKTNDLSHIDENSSLQTTPSTTLTNSQSRASARNSTSDPQTTPVLAPQKPSSRPQTPLLGSLQVLASIPTKFSLKSAENGRLSRNNSSTNLHHGDLIVNTDNFALSTTLNMTHSGNSNPSPKNLFRADRNSSFFSHFQKPLQSAIIKNNIRYIASLYSPFTSITISQELSPNRLSNTALDHFDYFPMDLCVAIYNTFVSLGFLSIFNCHYTTLQGLILCICSLYRGNSFHNFKHAFSVFQFCYVLLVHTGIDSYPESAIQQRLKNGKTRLITSSRSIPQADRLQGQGWMLPPFESCLVLLASLCHDIDHPGNTNQYEASTCSRLALLHNNKSILENHHCMITILLLQQPQVNVLKFLPTEKQIYAKKFIIECILATDMEHHFPTISKLAAISDINDLALLHTYSHGVNTASIYDTYEPQLFTPPSLPLPPDPLIVPPLTNPNTSPEKTRNEPQTPVLDESTVEFDSISQHNALINHHDNSSTVGSGDVGDLTPGLRTNNANSSIFDAFSAFNDTLPSNDGLLLSDDELDDGGDSDTDPNSMYFTALKDDQKLANSGQFGSNLGSFSAKNFAGNEVVSQVEISLADASNLLQASLLNDQNDGTGNDNGNRNSDLITTGIDEIVIKTLTKQKADRPKQEKDFLFLSQLFIHTADLCGQLFPLSIALKWEKCISEEFSQQGCMERAQNITPLPFLNDLHLLYNRSKGQVGFVSFVLLPWWIQLSRLFPSLGPYHRQCEDNKSHYQSIVNQIEAKRATFTQEWDENETKKQKLDPNYTIQPYLHTPLSHAPALPTTQPLPPHPTDPTLPLHKPCKHHGKWITIIPHKQLAQIYPFVTPNDQIYTDSQRQSQQEQYQAHLEAYGHDVLGDRLLNKDEQSQTPITTLPQREGDVPIPAPLSCGFHHMSYVMQQQQQLQGQGGVGNEIKNSLPIIVPILGPENCQNGDEGGVGGNIDNKMNGNSSSQLVRPNTIHSIGNYKHASRFITIWQCCHRLQPIPVEYDYQLHGE
jgi:hypothetical protein